MEDEQKVQTDVALSGFRQKLRNRRRNFASDRSLKAICQYFASEGTREFRWHDTHLSLRLLGFPPRYRTKDTTSLDEELKGYKSRQEAYRMLSAIGEEEWYRQEAQEKLFSIDPQDKKEILSKTYALDERVRAEDVTEQHVKEMLSLLNETYKLPSPEENVWPGVFDFSYGEYYKTLLDGVALIERTRDFRSWERNKIEQFMYSFYEPDEKDVDET